MTEAFDYSAAPCLICKPKTLGECGHDPLLADDEWLREQSPECFEDLGRRAAEAFWSRALWMEEVRESVLSKYPR